MSKKLCQKCGVLFTQDNKPDITIMHYIHPPGLTHLHLCTVCKRQLKEWLGIKTEE